MYINVSILIIIVTGILVWIVRFHNKKRKREALSEEFEDFTLLFRINQSLSIEIEEDLRNYINTRHTGNDFLRPGITLNMMLRIIENDNLTLLSDDALEKYEKFDPNGIQLRKSIEILQVQYKGLLTLNQEVNHHRILNLYSDPPRNTKKR